MAATVHMQAVREGGYHASSRINELLPLMSSADYLELTLCTLGHRVPEWHHCCNDNKIQTSNTSVFNNAYPLGQHIMVTRL